METKEEKSTLKMPKPKIKQNDSKKSLHIRMDGIG